MSAVALETRRLANPVELRMAGLRALNDALGYNMAQEFMSLNFAGSGDFTRERHEQPERSFEEVTADILRLDAERRARTGNLAR